jgi:hypothetical protein
MVKDMLSTPGMSPKGFKGKGAAWASQVRVQLAEIHAAMRVLSQETRAVSGHDFILTIHSRGKNGQMSLRWRLAGSSPRHVTWEAIAAHVAALPPALAQWYRQANAAALTLNYQEMAVRHELRLAEKWQDELRQADRAYERAQPRSGVQEGFIGRS